MPRASAHLSPRQLLTLRAFRNCAAVTGRTPTYDQVGALTGTRRSGVCEAVKGLELKGLMRRCALRAVELTTERLPDEQGGTRLPVIADFTEGKALTPSVAGPVDLGQLFGCGGAYALRVKGDGLRSEQLCDGDYVVVSRDARPLGRPVVVVLDDGSTVVRRSAQACGSVQGVVVGMLRTR